MLLKGKCNIDISENSRTHFPGKNCAIPGKQWRWQGHTLSRTQKECGAHAGDGPGWPLLSVNHYSWAVLLASPPFQQVLVLVNRGQTTFRLSGMKATPLLSVHLSYPLLVSCISSIRSQKKKFTQFNAHFWTSALHTSPWQSCPVMTLLISSGSPGSFHIKRGQKHDQAF